MADKEKVEALKSQGNTALQAGKSQEAIDLYTEAIGLDGENHVLFSNRSAAYAKMNMFSEAYDDAVSAIDIKPDWAKGYSRKGAALSFMNRYEEAKACYDEGLKYDPTNKQILNGIAECKRHLTGPAGSQPMGGPMGGNPFMGPNVMERLEKDSRTKEWLADPAYRTLVQDLQANPSKLMEKIQDPRVMTTLGVLMGFDLNVQSASDEPPPSATQTNKTSNPPIHNGDSSAGEPKHASNKKAKTEQTGDVTQTEAIKMKNDGNAAYKKKEFDEAIDCYTKAFELDPTNIAFLTNRAAAHFEKGDLEACRKDCELAVTEGRKIRTDYKIIAKAFARWGTSYMKEKDYPKAIVYFDKSLTENRTPETLRKRQEAEKAMKERERLAYIDPDKAAEEKTKGNECFKKGDFPAAIKHYSEAIKRNPDEAKVYSNRAACYTKLTEFGLGLKDCDKCIELDPTFIKGFLRKGTILIAMKDHAKARSAFEEAMELDSNNAEARQGLGTCYKAMSTPSSDPEEIKKRAMNDPEVQGIMRDPAMRMILEQMQENPGALQEHLKNPQIATNIQKLIQAGLISLR